MTDFAASRGPGRDRTSSFHESDNECDDDLDAPMVVGRGRTQSFHEDNDNEDTVAASSGGRSSRSNRKPGKKPGKVSRRTVEIMQNVHNGAQGGRPEKPRPLTEEERAERDLELSLRPTTVEKGGKKGEEQDESFDLYIKVLLLGDSGVGKTCLLQRYQENNYKHNFISTVGIDFKVHYLTVEGKRVKCQVWDTAGQERFHVITRAYYKGSHGIVLVYDITEKETFTNIEYWMDNISKHANQNVMKLLVGNKADLAKKRQTETEEAEGVAAKYGCKYFETSAKNGDNVEEAFYEIARQIVLNDGGKPVNHAEAGAKDQRKLEQANRRNSKGKDKKCAIL
jgi:small GTP-binding protein|eukprot:g2450.t1